jgi:hypothetical protein
MSDRVRSAVGVVEALECRRLLSGPYLIATDSAGGAIYDAGRQQVYVPTGTGSILRYDLSKQALLAPWTAIGGHLQGGDITPDGSAIYVTDDARAAGSGMVHKVTIGTGAVKHLPTPLDYDDTPNAVAITKDGKAWVSHQGQWGEMRVIDTATDTYGTTDLTILYGGTVIRGKDRSTAYFSERGISTLTGAVYDAATHAWTSVYDAGSYSAAVSPTGSEIALSSGYVDRKLELLRTIPGYVDPVGYDPGGALVYRLDVESHKVFAVDRLTNVTKFSFAVAADIEYVPMAGAGAATDDGRWLILPGSAGVHIYDLAAYKSPPAAPGGSIAGSVFRDANANGVRDGGEAGMAGVKIYLDANTNGAFDAGEKSVVTDAAGNYKLTGLAGGVKHRVHEVVPAGYGVRAPSTGYFVVAMAAGTSPTAVSGKVFGNAPVGSISGRVFNDANNNKVRDVGEMGLGLWKVFIDANNNGMLDSGEQSVLTDASGNWTLGSLYAGTYVVRVVKQAGVVTTTGGWISVAVGAGQKVTGKVFGERAIT